MKHTKQLCALALPPFLFLLSGCSTMPTTAGDIYGWKSLAPPRDNALGKEIFTNGVIGEQLITASEANTERSVSLASITKAEYSQASAGVEVVIQQLSVELGASYVKSEKLSSSDWQIVQVKNYLNELPVNRRFIYQCLSAKEHKFELESKIGGTASVDATKTQVAQKFGVETAKVEIKSEPEKPNKLEIKISNPNVCFSYVSARFVDDNDYITGSLADKYVDITGNDKKYNTSFDLELGQKSNWRTPQFIGREPAHKPLYRLMAVTNEKTAKTSLAVCKQDKGTGDKGYSCKELDDDGYGNWDRPYHIDTFAYNERKYKVIFLNIKAKLNGSKISVRSAQLQYPQYILRVE